MTCRGNGVELVQIGAAVADFEFGAVALVPLVAKAADRAPAHVEGGLRLLRCGDAGGDAHVDGGIRRNVYAGAETKVWPRFRSGCCGGNSDAGCCRSQRKSVLHVKRLRGNGADYPIRHITRTTM